MSARAWVSTSAPCSSGLKRTISTTITMAGIWELWSVGQCCTDAIRTSHLLGDPLTRVRFTVGHQVLLPLLMR